MCVRAADGLPEVPAKRSVGSSGRGKAGETCTAPARGQDENAHGHKTVQRGSEREKERERPEQEQNGNGLILYI